jgi:hypothetical protein
MRFACKERQSCRNEEEKKMLFNLLKDVCHVGWTFTKASAASFSTMSPVGYYDPRVNTRVASQLSAANLADFETGFAAQGIDDPWQMDDPATGKINPATGYWIPADQHVDVAGNPYGFNNDWD